MVATNFLHEKCTSLPIPIGGEMLLIIMPLHIRMEDRRIDVLSNQRKL